MVETPSFFSFFFFLLMYYVDDVMTCWRHVPSTGARAQLYAKSKRLLNIFFLLLFLVFFLPATGPSNLSSCPVRGLPLAAGPIHQKEEQENKPPKKHMERKEKKRTRQTLRRAVTGERHIIITIERTGACP